MSEARFRRHPGALWRRSLDAVAVLPVGVLQPITLAGSGPELWQLLVEWHTLADLAERLAETHGVAVETVVSDVAPMLDQLVETRAVERDRDH